MVKVVVSDCLLGTACRFDNTSKTHGFVMKLANRMKQVPVCPERAGALVSPRPPSEIVGTKVLSKTGEDVTANFQAGAQKTLAQAQKSGAKLCILKAKSPSCGSGQVYDGTFSGTLTPGWGIAAAALRDAGFTIVDEKTAATFEITPEHPVALILGSGFADLLSQVEVTQEIPYAEIPGYRTPPFEVQGHQHTAVRGTLDGVPVIVYPGRLHCYQGYSAYESTLLVRHAHALGARTVILTNASGGVDPALAPGQLCVLTDHINLTGQSPLIGADPALFDSPFVSMGDAYQPFLRTLVEELAEDLNISVKPAVYAGVLGPQYETGAEVRMIAQAGAHIVGMSTVHEAIMARALNMNVLGLSVVSNAAGISGLSHTEVLRMTKQASQDTGTLIGALLQMLRA